MKTVSNGNTNERHDDPVEQVLHHCGVGPRGARCDEMWRAPIPPTSHREEPTARAGGAVRRLTLGRPCARVEAARLLLVTPRTGPRRGAAAVSTCRREGAPRAIVRRAVSAGEPAVAPLRRAGRCPGARPPHPSGRPGRPLRCPRETCRLGAGARSDFSDPARPRIKTSLRLRAGPGGARAKAVPVPAPPMQPPALARIVLRRPCSASCGAPPRPRGPPPSASVDRALRRPAFALPCLLELDAQPLALRRRGHLCPQLLIGSASRPTALHRNRLASFDDG